MRIPRYGIPLLLLLAIIVTGCPRAQSAFQFAAMSDSRGAERGGDRGLLLGRLFKHCAQTHPDLDLMVFVGDMVDGDPGGPENLDQLERWKVIYHANMTAPLKPLIGNHEAKSPAAQEAYREAFPNVPQNGPQDERGLSYYFDHKNCRFVMLDTNYADDLYRLRHMDWIERVLAGARTQGLAHIFVFGHAPAFPAGNHMGDSLPNIGKDPANPNRENLAARDAFWAMLVKYRVTAYISGHEHKYVRSRIDGVWHIITGGGGAPLYDLPPAYPKADATAEERTRYENMKPYYQALGIPHGPGEQPYSGEFPLGRKVYHYLLLEVDGPQVRARVYGTEGPEKEAAQSEFSLLDDFRLERTANPAPTNSETAARQ